MTAPLYVELVERGAVQHADRIAMVVGEVEQTFAEVNARANRYGRAMQAQGVTPGARVALLINNSIASMPFDFACAKGGGEPGAAERAAVARRACPHDP